jgi:hypothetical protein
MFSLYFLRYQEEQGRRHFPPAFLGGWHQDAHEVLLALAT